MSEDQPARSRNVTWKDPNSGVAAARSLSGLDYLRAIQSGEIPHPPIMRLMGIDLVDVQNGRAVFAVVPGEYHYNPIGSVHGGLACTILDSAMSCAVHSTLPAGVTYTTLELKVNFLRALTQSTGRIVCTGTTIHVGGRIATADGRVTDESGKLYAHGTATCMIFREPQPRIQP